MKLYTWKREKLSCSGWKEGEMERVGILCLYHLLSCSCPAEVVPELPGDTVISSSIQGPLAVSFKSWQDWKSFLGVRSRWSSILKYGWTSCCVFLICTWSPHFSAWGLVLSPFLGTECGIAYETISSRKGCVQGVWFIFCPYCSFFNLTLTRALKHKLIFSSKIFHGYRRTCSHVGAD